MSDTLNPTQIGDISEAMVRARFIEKGYVVLVPLNSGLRYDIAVEKDGVFKRVQIKTGRMLDTGVILFNSSSLDPSTRNSQVDYYGDIDWFAIYCPFNRKTYLMNVNDTPPNHGRLRVEPTKNNQTKGIRWATDHEF